MSSLALTTISFPPVVFPKDKTSCKVSEVANLLSTYSFTAALVGSEVLLSKFSIPSVEVT